MKKPKTITHWGWKDPKLRQIVSACGANVPKVHLQLNKVTCEECLKTKGAIALLTSRLL